MRIALRLNREIWELRDGDVLKWVADGDDAG